MLTSNKPLVSVLIPLYNAAPWIAETLNKIRQQTYPNIEVIIVDDHSTDHSYRIASESAVDNVHLYVNPRKGGNAARNYAFEQSTGEYVKFMDADDLMESTMLERQLDRLFQEECPQKCIAFSKVSMLYPDGKESWPNYQHEYDYDPGIELLVSIWRGEGFHCPHCHLMHRDLVIKAGGWDETIIKNQDGEFFGRMYAVAQKALYVGETHAIWRQTGIGVSTKMTTQAVASVCKTHRILTKLILDYRGSREMKRLCAKLISLYLFDHYRLLGSELDVMKQFMRDNQLNFIVPCRRKAKWLSSLLGWEMAARILYSL